MFIQRLINQGDMPLIEQAVRFSAAREKLLADDVANVDTPGYEQKDLSVEKFQQALSERLDERRRGIPGSLGFDDVVGQMDNPVQNILFHDRNSRSMEQLMADSSKNALYHNMLIELLRKQITMMESALRERVS